MEKKITNNCCTIWLDVCSDFDNTPYFTCGIATVDIITGKSILYEFIRNCNSTLYKNSENLYIMFDYYCYHHYYYYY